MSQYKVATALLIKGEKHRAGAVVELSEADAARYGTALVPVAAAAPAAPAPEATPVEKLTKAQLVAACEANGLSAEGTKADLLERLKLAEITNFTEENA